MSAVQDEDLRVYTVRYEEINRRIKAEEINYNTYLKLDIERRQARIDFLDEMIEDLRSITPPRSLSKFHKLLIKDYEIEKLIEEKLVRNKKSRVVNDARVYDSKVDVRGVNRKQKWEELKKVGLYEIYLSIEVKKDKERERR